MIHLIAGVDQGVLHEKSAACGLALIIHRRVAEIAEKKYERGTTDEHR